MFQSTRPHGARHIPTLLRAFNECFNPRARMGRDLMLVDTVYPMGCFNPRARMGRDGNPPGWGLSVYCFNPRARMGRDPAQRF